MPFLVIRKGDLGGELLVGFRDTEEDARGAMLNDALVRVAARRMSLAARLMQAKDGVPISKILTEAERQEVIQEAIGRYVVQRA